MRVSFPGAIYHVMNRGANRQPVLAEEDAKALFFGVLAEAVRLWRIRIHAASLMDTHYHLLVETPLANLSRAMRHIDGVFTQRWNRWRRRDGPLFRGRFKSILVERETYFLALVRYIHQNPVQAGLVDRPEQHRYTSHAFYLQRGARPPWLTVSAVFDRFGGDTAAGRERLDRFVKAAVGDRLRAILDGGRWPAGLGGPRFYARLRRHPEARNQPEKPQWKEIQRPSPDDVLAFVAARWRLSTDVLGRARTPGVAEPRRAAALLLRRLCYATHRDIGARLGGISVGHVARLIKEAEPVAEGLIRSFELRGQVLPLSEKRKT